MRPPTPPRFIRDAMEIDDIEKTRPNVDTKNGRTVRDVLLIDDIEGTRAIQRHKPRVKSGGFTAEDYRDVTKMERKSKRCSNPLTPTYVFVDKDGQETKIGHFDVTGSRPACMPEPRKDRAKFGGSLTTTDILGA